MNLGLLGGKQECFLFTSLPPKEELYASHHQVPVAGGSCLEVGAFLGLRRREEVDEVGHFQVPVVAAPVGGQLNRKKYLRHISLRA